MPSFRFLCVSFTILLVSALVPRSGRSQIEIKPGVRGGAALMNIADLPGNRVIGNDGQASQQGAS